MQEEPVAEFGELPIQPAGFSHERQRDEQRRIICCECNEGKSIHGLRRCNYCHSDWCGDCIERNNWSWCPGCLENGARHWIV